MRAVIRLPSASRICTRVVGSVLSTSNRVPDPSPIPPVFPPALIPLALALVVVTFGKPPGIESEPTAGAEAAGAANAGTGDPNLCPAPPKALREAAEDDGGT